MHIKNVIKTFNFIWNKIRFNSLCKKPKTEKV